MTTKFDGEVWICDALHGITCDSGGSQPSGTTTATQTSAPWSGQQPYLNRVFEGANNLYNQGGPKYYPGQTLAPVAPQSQQAINLQTGRALAGSPVTTAANNNATATLNGNYLNPASNPWLQQTYDLAAGNLRSGLDGQFEGAGRYGSGAQQGALAQGYANLGSQIYGGNYQAERTNQLRDQTLAPSLANQDYVDLSQLGAAGAAQQSNQQNIINDQINRYNYNQQLPMNSLANYAHMIQGNYGGSATQTQPTFNNPAANNIGAGVGIASILGSTGAFSKAANSSPGWLSNFSLSSLNPFS